MFVFISQFPVFLIGKFAGISREKTPKLNVMVKKVGKTSIECYFGIASHHLLAVSPYNISTSALGLVTILSNPALHYFVLFALNRNKSSFKR